MWTRYGMTMILGVVIVRVCLYSSHRVMKVYSAGLSLKGTSNIYMVSVPLVPP